MSNLSDFIHRRDGTVTSVDLSVPSILTLSGNPITTAGTISIGLNSQSAYTVWQRGSGSGIPSFGNIVGDHFGTGVSASTFLGRVSGGGSGAPSFVSLTAADIPNLDTSKLTSGTLGGSRGGTNNGSLDFTAAGLIKTDGTKLVRTAGTALQVPRVNSGGTDIEWVSAGSGDVVGPASATDRTVPLFSGTGGKTLKNGPAISSASTLLMSAGSSADPEFVPMWGLAPGHRLTLESGVPVSITDQSAKGTLYLTPYLTNRCWLKYSGLWRPYAIDEISLSLTLTNGKPYDVFLYATSTTAAALEVLVWTNDTTRATAIVQDTDTKLPIKSGDATRLYVGTIWSTATNQTSDTLAKRLVFNMFNRVPRKLYAEDTTNSWSISSSTFATANGSTTSGVGRTEFIIGGFKADTVVESMYSSGVIYSAVCTQLLIGLALDSTTTPSSVASITGYNAQGSSTHPNCLSVKDSFNPSLGRHYIQNLEAVEVNGTSLTVAGDNGQSYKITKQNSWLMC